ncbi:MAG: AAA domain-containing protein [Gammaproteobacteria bacterium]|nr:AAA domain-containing protein [Gammaproteobacteria bacterium]
MLKEKIDEGIRQASEIILGKEKKIRLALACLLARGHLLIEDLPGIGKTTLSHVLASILGLKYQRIQFTSDLLPADILGVSIYEAENQSFRFHPGPIFAQMILADEINRATPKAQSALLEAMEEQQVSIEGSSYPLPQPFFIIATQNPNDQVGTFPLPESQLDRFMMRIELGYPDANAERALLNGHQHRDLIPQLKAVINTAELLQIQAEIRNITVSPAIIEYLQVILDFSRNSPLYLHGLSPRAGLAILHCAQSWAWLHKRGYVLPEDIQQVLPYISQHRLQATDPSTQQGDTLINPLLELPVP